MISDAMRQLVAMPQLEHCLRCIFVSVNSNAAEYMLTAEVETLYTTSDVLLARNFMRSERENNLLHEVGLEATNMLYDLFVWASSCRWRDKV